VAPEGPALAEAAASAEVVGAIPLVFGNACHLYRINIGFGEFGDLQCLSVQLAQPFVFIGGQDHHGRTTTRGHRDRTAERAVLVQFKVLRDLGGENGFAHGPVAGGCLARLQDR
jgi:hypothetical protein